MALKGAYAVINKLFVKLAVWYLTRDGIKHRYDPGDHFWVAPFIERNW